MTTLKICPKTFIPPEDQSATDCACCLHPQRLLLDLYGQARHLVCNQCFLPRVPINGNPEVCSNEHEKPAEYVLMDALTQHPELERLRRPVLVD